MKKHRLLQIAILAFFAASSIAGRAQFRAPSEEELKMTAEPKAPGADAVYLEYEETDNDKEHFQSYYARPAMEEAAKKARIAICRRRCFFIKSP